MSDTPETDAWLEAWSEIDFEGFDDLDDHPPHTEEFARKLERQRDEALELARELRELASRLRIHLMNLVDHEPCKCCYDDQAETDWAEAKSLLDKAKELLCN